MYKTSVAVICLLLGGCAASVPPPQVPAGSPQSRLRFAVDTTVATNIGANRVAQLACEATPGYMLGWFHPAAAGSWQDGRRLAGLRIGIEPPPDVPRNLYSEHVVAVDRPFFVQFGAALTACSGVVELPLQPGRDYEFRLTVGRDVCKPALFELSAPTPAAQTRTEVPLGTVVKSFACG